MRKIKFRAYNKTRKEMQKVTMLRKIPTMTEEHDEVLNEDYILMQYTGLKDKNGVEIYEGDILKSSYTKYGHEVIFAKSSFEIKHNKRCCPPYRTSLNEAEGWQEIIGNIFENKAL